MPTIFVRTQPHSITTIILHGVKCDIIIQVIMKTKLKKIKLLNFDGNCTEEGFVDTVRYLRKGHPSCCGHICILC